MPSQKILLKRLQKMQKNKAIANIATIMPDGSPHVVPVWFDFDGENVYVNTILNSRKDKNMQTRKDIAISVVDPSNLYKYVSLKGEVIERDLENGKEHINKLSNHYTGANYPNPDQSRVLYKIKPNQLYTL